MIIQSKNTINQSKFRGIMSTSKFPTPTTENLFQLEGIHYGLSHKKDFRAPDDPKLDPLHIHETLEIFLNVDSNVSFLVNNRLYPVKKGDALISRANEMHVGIFNEARIHEHFCLWIDADESSPIFDFLRSKDYSSHISFDESTSKQLTELFFELEDHIKRGNKGVGKASCFLKIMTIFNENQAVSNRKIEIRKSGFSRNWNQGCCQHISEHRAKTGGRSRENRQAGKLHGRAPRRREVRETWAVFRDR